MKNFELIDSRISVDEIASELRQNEPAWLLSTSRQRNIAVQRETESIFLRSAKNGGATKRLEDVHESNLAAAAALFPQTLAVLRDLSHRLQGDLGRALFARLQPGGQVYRHIDHGTYYACRDRYHLIIQSDGSDMNCGDEDVRMREGELWWFNNKLPHAAFNRSRQVRVHLIFDVHPHTTV
ncbi:aspartyl/asparaginyl beta-hydroxylase domain-containing protein [Cupriavidus sp. 8B]